jgi:hypothetical protein
VVQVSSRHDTTCNIIQIDCEVQQVRKYAASQCAVCPVPFPFVNFSNVFLNLTFYTEFNDEILRTRCTSLLLIFKTLRSRNITKGSELKETMRLLQFTSTFSLNIINVLLLLFPAIQNSSNAIPFSLLCVMISYAFRLECKFVVPQN